MSRTSGATTEHYGSPGRLADYRRQFERTTCHEGEDPVDICHRFGDTCRGCLGTWARTHDCDLYGTGSSSVTRFAHYVDALTGSARDPHSGHCGCRVWESHADTGIRRIIKPVPERALPVYNVDEPASPVASRFTG